ncbi:RbsD/FucU domain-containing protein [uncultured Clostridium sp.]
MTSYFQGIEKELISHVEFKERAKNVKVVIKTGDYTPYSNIMLIAGVPY